jgi:hypothetical protein
MTTITLEGKEYQLDIEQAKQLRLLKEKDGRVKSWDEFKEKYFGEHGFFYSPSEKIALRTLAPISISDQLTPHEATAIAAFSKLLKLRRDWIGEWEPDWEESNRKFILYRSENEVRTCITSTSAGVLSFPTQQMAQEFLETFRDLIEEAKILI